MMTYQRVSARRDSHQCPRFDGDTGDCPSSLYRIHYTGLVHPVGAVFDENCGYDREIHHA